jgi:ribosomal protein S18 acetylase RimI-like enzyme
VNRSNQKSAINNPKSGGVMSDDNPGFNIKIAGEQDATALAHLLERLEQESISPSEVRTRLHALKRVETTILASVEERAVGLACLRVLPSVANETPTAQVTELYVDKAQPGSGIEQALLAKGEELAQEHGAREVILLTGLRNTEAQSFYRSLGYQDYALAMRKMLKKTKDE